METVLKQNRVWQKEQVKKEVKRVGFFAGLFGCWHQELSRPFTTANQSYRVCLCCGARRHFNPETLQTYGNFYFSLAVKASTDQQ
jgi:hypothetical protein